MVPLMSLITSGWLPIAHRSHDEESSLSETVSAPQYKQIRSPVILSPRQEKRLHTFTSSAYGSHAPRCRPGIHVTALLTGLRADGFVASQL